MSQVTKVFVGSLPNGTKPEDLRHLFEVYGVVVECDVMNRCGFVHMQTPMMANNAIEGLNGKEIRGQKIVVEAGRPKEPKSIGRGGGRSMRDGDGRRDFSSGPIGRSRSPRGTGRMDGFHGSGGPGSRGPMPHRNNFGGGDKFQRNNSGPIRNSNYKSDRNAPYQRGGGGNGNSRFRDGNKFDGSSRESRFSGNSRNNYNDGQGNSYGGNHNQSGNWDRSNPNRSNFMKSFNNNDGAFSGQRDSIGQDRRGFALPTGGQQDRHGFSGANPGGYGGNDRSSGYGDRSIDRNMNGNASRGRGRGNFSGVNNNRGGPQSEDSMGFKRSQNYNNYMNEFPPLGGGGRGMNRNAPRQNMMSNRRY